MRVHSCVCACERSICKITFVGLSHSHYNQKWRILIGSIAFLNIYIGLNFSLPSHPIHASLFSFLCCYLFTLKVFGPGVTLLGCHSVVSLISLLTYVLWPHLRGLLLRSTVRK